MLESIRGKRLPPRRLHEKEAAESARLPHPWPLPHPQYRESLTGCERAKRKALKQACYHLWGTWKRDGEPQQRGERARGRQSEAKR